jgi:hypothetical protein
MAFIFDFAEIASGSHGGTNEAPCSLNDRCQIFRETYLHIHSIA